VGYKAFAGSLQFIINTLLFVEREMRMHKLGLTCLASVILSPVLGIPSDANKAFGSREVVLLRIEDRVSRGIQVGNVGFL
jgi:hypothetical protein